MCREPPSTCGKQDIAGNTGPHSQTHRFREMCRASRTISHNRAPVNDSHKRAHLYRAGQTLSLSRAYVQG